MPNHDWEEFQQYALKIDDLHHELQAAEATCNSELARSIGRRIKDAEIVRDRLLCRIGHTLSAAA